MTATLQTHATPDTRLATAAPETSPWAVVGSRIAYELRSYFRRVDVVVFTFLFPVMLLLVFSMAFGSFGEISPGITMNDYYLPSMLAAGVAFSGVQNLAVDIATEKSDGTLRRLAATPLRPWQYFAGKFGQVFVTASIQTVLIILAARFILGVSLPSTATAWLTAGWVYLLGLVGCAFLGIALSAVPRNGAAAVAVVIPMLLVLMFVSGIYLPITMLPEWLQAAAGVFPLRWVGEGLRAAFLPAEATGGANLTMVAVVLGSWLVAGAVLAKLTFRWYRRT